MAVAPQAARAHAASMDLNYTDALAEAINCGVADLLVRLPSDQRARLCAELLELFARYEARKDH